MILSLPAICLVLVSFVLYALYQFVLKPYRGLLWYKKQGIPIYYFFPALGLIKLFSDDLKNHKDSMYFSKVMSQKDKQKIYSLNLASSVLLLVVDPSLIKECLLSPDLLAKDPFLTNSLIRFFGTNNILVGEGKEWKKSRKVITNSFTFNFLIDNVPNIINAVEQRLENINDGKNNVDLRKLLEGLVSEALMSVLFDKDLASKLYEGKPLSHWVIDILNRLAEQTLSPLNFLFGENFFKLGLRSTDRNLNRDLKNVKQIFSD